MTFCAAVDPPANQIDVAWWFIFHGNDLLIHSHEDAAGIPQAVTPETFGLRPLRTQYLGSLDDRHCYSAEVAPDELALPDGMQWSPLRPVFGVVAEEMFWLAGRAFQIMNWDRTHQFCSQCGQPVERLAGERAKICRACKLSFYPRIAPAIIVAIVNDNREILLARSNRFPFRFYSVLAGFVEAGETFEECVRREVREEVGVEVRNIRYFSSQPWPFPNSLMVGFTAEYAGGGIQIDGKEIVEAGWYRADALPVIPGKVSIARKLIDWFVANYSS